ncbi:hypothetical protein D3C71_1871600 [compost metagenome]
MQPTNQFFRPWDGRSGLSKTNFREPSYSRTKVSAASPQTFTMADLGPCLSPSNSVWTSNRQPRVSARASMTDKQRDNAILHSAGPTPAVM